MRPQDGSTGLTSIGVTDSAGNDEFFRQLDLAARARICAIPYSGTFTEDKAVEIKECEFDRPAKKKSSTGLYPGMFNEDVGFRFQVNVKVTDPKDVEKMLKLFNRAAADFNETWKKAVSQK